MLISKFGLRTIGSGFITRACSALLVVFVGQLHGAVYTVNSSLDDPDGNSGDNLCDTGDAVSGPIGVCTLRAALQIAQMGDTIVFSESVRVIRPLSALPGVRCSILGRQNSSVTIDGLWAGDSHGLRIESAVASGAKISYLTITGFQRSGIYVAGHPVSGAPAGVIIEECAIGTPSGLDDVTVEWQQGNGAGITILGVNGVLIRNNVISGNGIGIEVYSNFATGDYTQGVRIVGNIIGLNGSGTEPVGNGVGIVMGQSPTQFIPGINVVDCVIGGPAPEDENVIAGNKEGGIVIQGDNFSGPPNKVIGNHIGSFFLPDSSSGPGILLKSCDGTIVSNNSIVGNRGHGIHITTVGNNRASGNVVESNRIQRNYLNAVHIDAGALLTRIGGEGAGNIITENTKGIVIVGETTSRHSIVENEIFNNESIGIDLGGDHIWPPYSSPGRGPNLSQPAPEFLSIQRTNGNTIIRARIDSNLNPPFIVEFFDNTACDQRGYGPGEIPLQRVTIPFEERLDFTVTIPGEHHALTMISTDQTGNSSEFSTCNIPWVVNSTADLPDIRPGDGVASTGNTLPDGRLEVTLRAALQEANDPFQFRELILFDIPGAGPHVINLSSALPDITLPVAVDATSQPGYTDGNPMVEVNGSALGQNPLNGFNIRSARTAIRGLAIVNFGKNAIFIQGHGDSVLEANFIGLRSDGTTPAGSSESGIHILDSAENLIGGMDSASRNVVTGNGKAGTGGANITIEGARSTKNHVLGNYIGTDKTGGATPPNPTGADGISLLGGTSENVIGGATASAGNLISGNRHGIQISDAASVSNRIEGNIIGLDAAANRAVPNRRNGIFLAGGNGNRIGGSAAAPGTAPGNIISGNSFNGVEINTDDNHIEGNIIGTSPGGSLVVGNALNGILLRGKTNVIGGNDLRLRNLISGNIESGILISGSSSQSNRIEGNFIGVNAAGTAPIPNRTHGVHIRGGRNNIIGGDRLDAGNLISGNSSSGIQIESLPGDAANLASDNHILGNSIGVNAAGLGALANNSGIVIQEAPGHVIGGVNPEHANVVSGNLTEGIHIQGAGSTDIRIQQNIIGMNAAGLAPLGNGGNGIWLDGAIKSLIGGPAPLGNVIGGNGAVGGGHGIIIDGTPAVGQENAGHRVEGNWVGVARNLAGAGNAVDGIRIVDASGNFVGPNNSIAQNQGTGVTVLRRMRGDRNDITGNSIHRNGILGIDLSDDGPTLNDSDDADTGANLSQNFPELIAYGGAIQAVFVHLRSTPNTLFRIELFRNTTADPSGFGEGERLFDQFDVTTDGEGHARFSRPLPVLVAAGECISATARNLFRGDTSEFSTCVTAQPVPLADFGDAPGAQHRTRLAENGARHLVNPAIRLGALIDAEADAQIDPLNALGDDSENSADEDGIEFLAPIVPGGAPTRIQVTASVSGFLSAWLDIDKNETFGEAGEQIVQDAALIPGANMLELPVPPNALPGITYARFRFSTTQGLAVSGAAPDGEVEDYQVTIAASEGITLQGTESVGGKLRTRWMTRTGWKYQMQFKRTLSDPTWQPLGSVYSGDGTTMSFEDSADAAMGYYRLTVTPP